MNRKIMFIVMTISLVSLLSGLIIHNNYSAATIGGADGPTSIFVTGSYSPWIYYVGLIFVFLITGLIRSIVLKNREKMSGKKSTIMALTVFFAVATIYGSINVILSHGRLNAGYAVIPMVATIALMMLYRGQDR